MSLTVMMFMVFVAVVATVAAGLSQLLHVLKGIMRC